jgi:hypothetical protein
VTQDKGWGGPSSDGPEDGGPHSRPGSPPNGPNAPYGWGAWGPATLPPKPGVIPLGPLGLGEIFNGAFATVGRYWKQLLGVAAAVYGVSAVVVIAAAVIAYGLVGGHLRTLIDLPAETDPSWDDVRPLVIAFGCVMLIAILLLIGSMAMAQAAAPVIMQNAVLGRPATLGEIWRRASARVPAVIGTLLLTWLITLVPIGLFIGIIGISAAVSHSPWLILVGFLSAVALGVAAAWLWVRFSLAAVITVIESQGPVASLRRSFHLVRGSWWRVAGISFLGYLLAGAASWVIQIVAQIVTVAFGSGSLDSLDSSTTPGDLVSSLWGFYAALVVAQLIGEIVAMVFPPVVTSLIYLDRRIRTENLAPALIAAARADGRLEPAEPGPAV